MERLIEGRFLGCEFTQNRLQIYLRSIDSGTYSKQGVVLIKPEQPVEKGDKLG